MEITIKIYNYGTYFEAVVGDWWYVARGDTKAKAIKNVIKRIEKELGT